MKLPVQSGWSPCKYRTGQAEFKSNRFLFCRRTENGCSPPMWRIYQGIRERGLLSVGTFKALSHPASLFIVGSHRSGIAWGGLTNWHLPLCLWPEGSSEERRPGKFKKSVSFSPFFCRVSFPWKLGFRAWGGRGWRHLLFRPVICAWRSLSRCWAVRDMQQGRGTEKGLLLPTALHMYAAVGSLQGRTQSSPPLFLNPSSLPIPRRQP